MARFRPALRGCFESRDSARAAFEARWPNHENWLRVAELGSVGPTFAIEPTLHLETQACLVELIPALMKAKSQFEQLKIFDTELPKAPEGRLWIGRDDVATAIEHALSAGSVALRNLLADAAPEAVSQEPREQRKRKRRRLHRTGYSDAFEQRFGRDVEVSIGGVAFPKQPRDQWLAITRWYANQLREKGRTLDELTIEQLALLAVASRADRLDTGTSVSKAEDRLRDRWKKVRARVVKWERGETGPTP